MTERLEIDLSASEYRAIEHLATEEGMTVAAWARRALREACRMPGRAVMDAELAAVRARGAVAYPTSEPGQMLSEIADGYETQGGDDETSEIEF